MGSRPLGRLGGAGDRQSWAVRVWSGVVARGRQSPGQDAPSGRRTGDGEVGTNGQLSAATPPRSG